MFQPSTLKFLRDLKKNNHKPWFDAHRGAYDAARADFEKFVGAVLSAHVKKDKDLEGLTAKKCIFRINRDVRFSKNKLPYKNNFAASMDKGGRKSGLAGYYFHLEPGHSFIGAGIWQPEPATVKNRQEIDYSAAELEEMFNRKKFKSIFPGLYTGEDVQLKKVPQGFEKDNPAAHYLRFKSWMILSDVTNEDLVSPTLVKKTLDAFAVAQPFIKFLNRPLT